MAVVTRAQLIIDIGANVADNSDGDITAEDIRVILTNLADSARFGTDALDGAAIKTAYEAQADTNAFTDAQASKLAGIEAGADVNSVLAVAGLTGAILAADLRAQLGIEAGATADQTGAEIVASIDAELGGAAWQSTLTGGTLTGEINFSGTDHLGVIPISLTTTERDGNTASGNPIIFNSTTGQFEGWDGSQWVTCSFIAASAPTIANKTTLVAGDTFTGYDSQNSFEFFEGSVGSIFNYVLAQELPGPKATYAENAQTGTAYTLAVADHGRGVAINNAGANTLTIPTNASIPIPVGAMIPVVQIGAGVTTITAAAGVTLNGVSGGSVGITEQWGGVSLWQTGADTWLAVGAVGAVS